MATAVNWYPSGRGPCRRSACIRYEKHNHFFIFKSNWNLLFFFLITVGRLDWSQLEQRQWIVERKSDTREAAAKEATAAARVAGNTRGDQGGQVDTTSIGFNIVIQLQSLRVESTTAAKHQIAHDAQLAQGHWAKCQWPVVLATGEDALPQATATLVAQSRQQQQQHTSELEEHPESRDTGDPIGAEMPVTSLLGTVAWRQ